MDSLLNAYRGTWFPIPHQDYWPLLPNYSRAHDSGRPRSTHIRNEMDCEDLENRESGEGQTCIICNGRGHNRKRCPHGPM